MGNRDVTLYQCEYFVLVHFVSRFVIGRFLQKLRLWKRTKKKKESITIMLTSDIFEIGDTITNSTGEKFLVKQKRPYVQR